MRFLDQIECLNLIRHSFPEERGNDQLNLYLSISQRSFGFINRGTNRHVALFTNRGLHHLNAPRSPVLYVAYLSFRKVFPTSFSSFYRYQSKHRLNEYLVVLLLDAILDNEL